MEFTTLRVTPPATALVSGRATQQLFIYKDESLILVTFRTERNKVFAEYHEMKENHAFEKIAHIDRHLRNTNSCMIAAKFLLLLTLFLQKP